MDRRQLTDTEVVDSGHYLVLRTVEYLEYSRVEYLELPAGPAVPAAALALLVLLGHAAGALGAAVGQRHLQVPQRALSDIWDKQWKKPQGLSGNICPREVLREIRLSREAQLRWKV